MVMPIFYLFSRLTDNMSTAVRISEIKNINLSLMKTKLLKAPKIINIFLFVVILKVK